MPIYCTLLGVVFVCIDCRKKSFTLLSIFPKRIHVQTVRFHICCLPWKRTRKMSIFSGILVAKITQCFTARRNICRKIGIFGPRFRRRESLQILNDHFQIWLTSERVEKFGCSSLRWSPRTAFEKRKEHAAKYTGFPCIRMADRVIPNLHSLKMSTVTNDRWIWCGLSTLPTQVVFGDQQRARQVAK